MAQLEALAVAPRPVGSAANARAREHIVGRLAALGYSPQVQETFSCGRFGICAAVKNVVARLEGRSPGKAVLLMAHYDSVSAGPGASDDGAGVAAVLEVAAALRHGQRPLHPVILLLDDGEEGGLIGAVAFRAEHPWAREVGAVVNLEARGTSGPSLMFETSGDTAWLARALSALPHPHTSSLFSTVYELLPNDTDLSVFKSERVPGVNFAFIREVVRYHTPLDSLANSSAATLQHHGENALAMVRALAESELDRPPRGDAVFFDVLGLGVVSWPAPLTLPLSVTALLLIAAAVALAIRRGRLTLREMAWGLGAFLAAPILAGGLALLLQVLWRFGFDGATAFPRAWVAYPLPALLAVGCAGVAFAWAAGALLWRRAGPQGLWAGASLGWGLVGLPLSAALPGMAYLFTLPALAAGVAGLAWSVCGAGERGLALVAVTAAAGAGILFFPLLWLLYDALGMLAAPLLAAVPAMVALLLAPLVPGLGSGRRWAAVAVPAAAALAGAIVASVLPDATVERPEPTVVSYHEDADAGTAQWFVYRQEENLPEAMRRAAAFGAKRTKPFEWAGFRPSFVAQAHPMGAPAPDLHVLSREEHRGGRRIRARLTSLRGASDVFLAFPPEAPIEAVSFDGKTVPPVASRVRRWFYGWQVYRCLTVPPAGMDVEINVRGSTGPIEVQLVDQTLGLPPGGEALLAARPPTAVTLQDGDTTFVSRRLTL